MLDLRDVSVQYPKITLTAFLVLLVIYGYGAWIAKSGGIVDKGSILNRDDPYYQMDQYVQAKQQEGFMGAECVPLILKFPGGIRGTDDLKKILHLHRDAEDAFGRRILSLAEAPNYKDTGEALLDVPYVGTEVLDDKVFDVKKWREDVRSDPAVYGILVGRRFDWASLLIYLPPGYDEMVEAWRIVEFIEGRRIGKLERLFKKDIHRKDGMIGVAGWIMGRWTTHQGLIRDKFFLISLGLVLTTVIFGLSTGSFRQALFTAVLVIIPAILMVRGSVGLLEKLGFDVRERVFILLAYANCIVQGISFSLHKFECLNRCRDWSKAKEVDYLIGITACIAIGGFITLYWFEVLTIRELGLLSALGVIYVLSLSVIILPAAYTLMPCTNGSTRRFELFSSIFDKTAHRCVCLHASLGPRKGVVLMAVILGGATIIPALLVARGKLATESRPLEYIHGSLAYETAQFLNRPGQVGFDFLELLAEPAARETKIYDPHFIAALRSYQQDLKAVAGAREVSSIVGTIEKISRESYGKPLPETANEVSEAIFLLEGNLSRAVARQLWYDRGIRLSASTDIEETDEARAFVSSCLKLAHRYPELKVSSFGKIALYPQTDLYIIMGKPKNLFSSQWVIVVVCAMMIFRKTKCMGADGGRCHWELLSGWGSLAMSVPFIFASGVMCLVMIIMHIPLDIVTAAITALAINASVDFAIYFVDSYQEALRDARDTGEAVTQALQDKGVIVIKDMLLNAVCFAPLLTSHFSPIRSLGWIMGVMLVFCCIGTLIVMPPFLMWATRENRARR